jgi:hypothetical protein
VFFFRELVLCIAKPTVGFLFRPEHRLAFPRSDLERSNRIYQLRMEDTGSAGDFVKEPL